MIDNLTGYQLVNCDAIEGLRSIESESIDCIVTSPPYWGMRDYGIDGQIGLESTLDEFLTKLVAIFDECYRVLKTSGTMWVNMGDCYITHAGGAKRAGGGARGKEFKGPSSQPNRNRHATTLPRKSMAGQPWRLAFALQDFGWVLRRDIIWEKPSAMPESCKDRCTTAHEYIFHFTKSDRYFYNFDAVAVPAKTAKFAPVSGHDTGKGNHCVLKHNKAFGGTNSKFRTSKNPGGAKPSHKAESGLVETSNMRNLRSVWTIPSGESYSSEHFASFPEEIPRRCILAGCPDGGIVLDPFAGSGTTLAVAKKLGLSAIGIEINPEYCKIIERRLSEITPSLFT